MIRIATRLARVCLGQALCRRRDGPAERCSELEQGASQPMPRRGARVCDRPGVGGHSPAHTGRPCWSAAASPSRRSPRRPQPATTLRPALRMSARRDLASSAARSAGALEIIDDAVRLADQSPGRRGHRYPVHVTRGRILIELDRLEKARAALDDRPADQRGTRRPLAPASYQAYAVARSTSSPGSGMTPSPNSKRARAGGRDRSELHPRVLPQRPVPDQLSPQRPQPRGRGRRRRRGPLAETGARYRRNWVMWAAGPAA